jgi:hypothetical protein
MGAGGAAAVSVTSIAPVAVTEKLWTSLPPTVTVPLNVSVVRVVVVVAAVVLLVRLQPAPTNATNTTLKKASAFRM